jgi:threonine/homoserine/homoserine lactone efflux protein
MLARGFSVTISLETFASFVLTCFVIEVTPGPNMAYLAVLSAGHGRRAGFAAVVGIAFGLLIIGLAGSLGLAALIQSSSLAYEALRWSGVAFLLWLAWDGWSGADDMSATQTGDDERDSVYFSRGLITNLLNPKAMVFYIAVLPTFVDRSVSVLGQTVTLTLIYVTIATSIHSAIVLLAGAARPFLEDPVRSHDVRRGLSLALAMIAIWFAFSTAPSH